MPDILHMCLTAGSGHRLFLISRKTEASVGADGGPVEEFIVLGATGVTVAMLHYLWASTMCMLPVVRSSAQEDRASCRLQAPCTL